MKIHQEPGNMKKWGKGKKGANSKTRVWVFRPEKGVLMFKKENKKMELRKKRKSFRYRQHLSHFSA